MKLLQRILSNTSLFIIVLLLFLLIFQDRVVLPPLLQATGRMHPMLLHLPIGLLITSALFWLFRKNIDADSFQKLFSFLLNLTAFTALLTALFGFFLSREDGYEEIILNRHKFLGVATAIFAYVLLLLYKSFPEKTKLFAVVLSTNTLLMIIGSHFGSNLTHGEGFIFQPLQKEEYADEIITDSSTLFAAAVRPILKSKCFTCHNEKKAKGGLVMTSLEKLLAGGKNGAIWKSGDPANSHLIQYAHLPVEDKKHMPPKGKPQLTEEEKNFLFAWIRYGADTEKQIRDYADTDTLKMIASKFIVLPQNEIREKEYSFDKASAATIQNLNNPFLSIFPVSQNSPALQADFFVSEKFNSKKLSDLLKVKEQLVSLNLNKMPVTDEDLKTVSRFENLEKLFLNNTKITSKGMEALLKLKNLQLLSLAGTAVDGNALSVLAKMDSLKNVFIWNSAITAGDPAVAQISTIKFETGYKPDEHEVLVLTVPTLVNEGFVLSEKETIQLKHQIAGVRIRYTTDGTIPDSSNSPEYKNPVPVNGFVIINTRATKPGWYSSPVASYSFFKKGITPDETELLTKPNEKYKGEGSKTIVDSKKGTADNFSDASWLGYKESPFSGLFYFEKPQSLSSITISYNVKVQSYIMPPTEVEVWGGSEKNKLKLLKKVFPKQTTKEDLNLTGIQGLRIDIPSGPQQYYKVVARNIQRLPSWHPGKGEKGWVFIDEVFFNN